MTSPNSSANDQVRNFLNTLFTSVPALAEVANEVVNAVADSASADVDVDAAAPAPTTIQLNMQGNVVNPRISTVTRMAEAGDTFADIASDLFKSPDLSRVQEVRISETSGAVLGTYPLNTRLDSVAGLLNYPVALTINYTVNSGEAG